MNYSAGARIFRKTQNPENFYYGDEKCLKPHVAVVSSICVFVCVSGNVAPETMRSLHAKIWLSVVNQGKEFLERA